MAKQLRIASLMLHTSPLEQAGIGDAGGMNVYVVESAKRIAESGLALISTPELIARAFLKLLKLLME